MTERPPKRTRAESTRPTLTGDEDSRPPICTVADQRSDIPRSEVIAETSSSGRPEISTTAESASAIIEEACFLSLDNGTLRRSETVLLHGIKPVGFFVFLATTSLHFGWMLDWACRQYKHRRQRTPRQSENNVVSVLKFQNYHNMNVS